MRRGSRALLVGAALLAGAGHAHGQETAQTRSAAVARLYERPYTQAELGIGTLALPTSNICLTRPNTCTTGDMSPFVYLMMLYRPNGHWAIGAAATYGYPAKSDTPQVTYANLDRSHSRQYLLIDAILRYYAIRLGWLEGWGGFTLGAVVINDMYENNTESPSAPILGPKAVSTRTEGLSTGVAGGLGWTFAQNWSVEGLFRMAWWYLPSFDNKACAPTGDCATLYGQVPMFSLGGAISYRIGL